MATDRRVDGHRSGSTVEVVSYDDRWPALFVSERAILQAGVRAAIAVEHVGSTSVPGMASKPTIDIMLTVGYPRDLPSVILHASAVGYQHRPGSFDDMSHLFFVKTAGERRTHHLHAVVEGSEDAAGYRRFRELLTHHPASADRYRRAKLELASRFADDRSSYVRFKERLVEELLAEPRSEPPD